MKLLNKRHLSRSFLCCGMFSFNYLVQAITHHNYVNITSHLLPVGQPESDFIVQLSVAYDTCAAYLTLN